MRRERWRNFDFWLFGVVIILCFFGIVMIQSALAGNLEVSINSQILYVSIGLVFILACAFFDFGDQNHEEKSGASLCDTISEWFWTIARV